MDGFIFGFVDNAVLIFGSVTGLEVEGFCKIGGGIGGEVTSSPERDPQTTKQPTSPSDKLPD